MDTVIPMNAVGNTNREEGSGTDSDATERDEVPQAVERSRSDDERTEDEDRVAGALDPLSKDELFHLLQNQRRRRVLLYLQEAGTEATMRAIAEQVAAWENDTTVTALDSDERQRVYIALYQSHLPKLDDAGVLTYDQNRGIVSRTELADQLDAYLNIDPETDAGNTEGDSDEAESSSVEQPLSEDEAAVRSTSDEATQNTEGSVLRYYTGATLISTVITLLAWTGVTGTSGQILTTAITVLFGVLTIGLFYRQHQATN